MKDIINYFAEGKMSRSLTYISDSVNGHLIVYAAEKSRKERRIVEVEQ